MGSGMKLRKKMIGIPVGAVALAVAASVAATQPAQAVNPDGSFQLKAATGKCVEVIPDASGNFYVNGNRIQQRTCDGSPQQQWFLERLSGAFQGIGQVPRYHLVNRMTLQCLDDMDGATNNRNPVQQWTCNPTSSSMVWAVLGPQTLGDQIYNERASKCLDVTDGSLQDGARLQIYNCFDDDGNIAQHYVRS
jgi:Ricin-type beta-trefoil lectin domain-like